MGIFSFFRRKKKKEEKQIIKEKESSGVVVSFSKGQSTPQYSYPWDASRPNSDSEFSKVKFLRMYCGKARKVSIDPNDFGRCVSYDFHIYNPVKYQNEMISAGYIRMSTTSEVLKTLTVSKLKEILEQNGLKKTGKKNELIDRIIESIPESDLNLPPMCCISEKGSKYLEDHHDLVDLAQKLYGVTYDEFMEAKKESKPYMKYHDIIWLAFNIRENKSNGAYSVRQRNAYDRAELLHDEGKNEESLQQYLIALWYDVNDPIRVHYPRYSDNSDYFMPVSTDLIEKIRREKEYFNGDMVEKCFDRYDVPKRLITLNQFQMLVNDILEEKEIDIKNYLS